MFAARTFCRSSSAPLRQAFRKSYATENTASKTLPSSNSTSSSYLPLIIALAGAGSGLAGYQFLGNRRVHAESPAAAATAPTDVKKAFTGGDQGFFDLKLEKVEDYNHDTKKLRFSLPEGDMVSGLTVASAILTKFKAPDAEKPTLRPYTPVSDEGDKGYLDLLVKVYPNGVMSEHMSAMKPGETLSFKGPLPKYPWAENKHDHITLISGGTGITPMYQLIRAIFNNPNDKTKVSLVFGNKTLEDVLLKEEFDELEKKFPEQFRTFYTLDKPPKSWPSGSGYISKELLKEVIPDPKSENIKVFVCGPPGLCKAISGPKKSPQDQGELDGVLKELGYTKDQVYKF